jgi:spermidine synthase
VAGTGRLLETTQILQGHLPLLLYEAQNGKAAKRVLTVGLGSGGTSGALSLHNLEEIHCVELTRGVLTAAQQFFQVVNHNVFADPRYHVFIQDGRTYLLADRTKYDVVMTESVHPAYAGNASLYSRDYYQNCKERLSENGVISVWVPLDGLSEGDLKMICKTFLDVFPHAAMWHGNNGNNQHVQLIATQAKLSIDFERFSNQLQEPKIRQDLARMDLDDVYTLLNSLWLDERALREYSHDAPVTSDDHPYLAFSASRVSASTNWLQTLDQLLQRRTPVLPYLKSLGSTEEQIARNSKALATEFAVAGYLTAGFASCALEDYGNALQMAGMARNLNPNNRACRYLFEQVACAIANQQIARGDVNEALATTQHFLSLDPDSGSAYRELCQIRNLRGELALAIRAGEEARRRLPEDTAFSYYLAILYVRVGAVEKARPLLEELQRKLPGEPMVEETLANLGLRP